MEAEGAGARRYVNGGKNSSLRNITRHFDSNVRMRVRAYRSDNGPSGF